MEVFDLLIKKVIEELKGRLVQLKDTHLIYLILSKIFDEYDEVKLMKKIISLSRKKDEEIKEFLSKIKMEEKNEHQFFIKKRD